MKRFSGRSLMLPALFLGLVLVASGWTGVSRARSGVTVTHRLQPTVHGQMPVDVYQAARSGADQSSSCVPPTVVVVHGFAANKELMRPFGLYLARLGFRAYVVDVSGHGHHNGLLDRPGAPADIASLVNDLVASGEAMPGRIALVGHSMGTDIVTEEARNDPRVAATVVFSSITSDVQPGRPGDYLMLTAGRDIPNVRDTFARVMAAAGVRPGKSPKDLAALLPAEGDAATAIRGIWVPGRNHISILYDRGALQAMGLWLSSALGPAGGQTGIDPLAPSGFPWAIALMTGALLLFLFLAAWAGRLVLGYDLQGTDAPRPYLWVLLYLLAGLVAIGIASLGQPLSFLHLMMSDYIAYYLVIVVVVLEVVRRLLHPTLIQQAHANLDLARGWPSALLGLLLFVIFFALIAPTATATLSNLLPGPGRIWRGAVLFPLLLPFFLIDENIKAAVQTRYGGWIALGLSLLGKAVIAGTWVLALKLPRSPFFLVIAMPVLIGVFALMDALTTLIFSWRRESMSLAVFKALTFAWLLAVAFPLGTGF